MKLLNNRNIIFILFICILSFSYSITVSTNYTFEPAFNKEGDLNCYDYNKKIPLSDKMCDHREFLNNASGDSIQYFMIAMGKDNLSHPPYTYQPLVPKTLGFLAKISLQNKINDLNYNDLLFKRISQLARVLNLICCAFLILIPFYHFRNSFYKNNLSNIFFVIAIMNLINIGVLMTAPFLMLDIPTYVLFTAAASFFFRKNFLGLFATICIGVFLKQIVMVLLIPFWFLLIKENKASLILKILFGLFPIFLFLGSRYFFSGEFSDFGQLGYDITQDPFEFRYFKIHVYELGIFNFIGRILSSIGFVLIITIFIYFILKKNKDLFVVIIFMTVSILVLNLLLASGVLRVAQVATPFLIFYCLHVLCHEKNE